MEQPSMIELEEMTEIEHERRVVRLQYAAIQNIINEEREAVTSVDSNKFISIINEVEELHQLVKKPREQIADAETLLELASSLVSSVKSYATGGITPSDFVSSLLQSYGRRGFLGDSQNSIYWKKIGYSVSSALRNGGGCCTMLGPMKNELKERKLSVCRKRIRGTESLRPEVLDNNAEEKPETDKNMLTMFEILRKKKSARLESLVLNRKSYAQTVENLFALSFLVKDGRVAISIDENGSQLVSPTNAPASSAIASRVVSYHHFVFRFDFKDWKLMMDMVPEQEELMPSRDVVNVPNDSISTPLPKDP